jgi:hypothetical protein
MYDKLEGNFKGWEVTHIDRESNEETDALAGVKVLIHPSTCLLRGDFQMIYQDQTSNHRTSVSNTTGGCTYQWLKKEQTRRGSTNRTYGSGHASRTTTEKAICAYLLHGELLEDLAHRR